MASKRRSGGSRWETWPKKAIAVFGLFIIAIYAVIFLTGDRSATPKLGIDLRGGTRITLVPQGATPTQDQLQQAKNILENRVNGMGVSGANVIVDGTSLVITVPGEDTSQARAVGQTSQLLFRPVVQPDASVDNDSIIKAIEEMGNRWVTAGVMPADQVQKKFDELRKNVEKQKAAQEEQAKKQGNENQQLPEVKVPDLKVTAKAPAKAADSIAANKQRTEQLKVLKDDRQSKDAAKQLAASTLMVCSSAPDPLQGSDDPALPLVACDASTNQPYILGEVPLLVGQTDPVHGKRLTGNEIDSNRPITGGLNSQTGQMEISFAFKAGDNEKGSETWADLTQKYLQQQVAITLDSKIISAPQIQSPTPVGSATAITGKFTQDEATELANNLRYGALPLSFAGENGESGGTAITVPASLGLASLKAGLFAGLVGFALVALFSLFFYRIFGLVSLVSLVLAEVLVYGALVLLGRLIGYSLDLAGIAGLIIGIGATADSFVVLYERIKDEIRHGLPFGGAACVGPRQANHRDRQLCDPHRFRCGVFPGRGRGERFRIHPGPDHGVRPGCDLLTHRTTGDFGIPKAMGRQTRIQRVGEGVRGRETAGRGQTGCQRAIRVGGDQPHQGVSGAGRERGGANHSHQRASCCPRR